MLRTIEQRRSDAKKKPALLGLDLGTGGLDATVADAVTLDPLPNGRAEAGYPTFMDGSGRIVQDPRHWEEALAAVLHDLRERGIFEDCQVVAVGISGQMHAGVWLNEAGESCSLASLWNCNSAVSHGKRFSKFADYKVDGRLTVSHVFKELEQRPDWWLKNVRKLTTPAGFLGFLLSGEETSVGIGEASGTGLLYPMDAKFDFDYERLSVLRNLDPAIEKKLPKLLKPGARYDTCGGVKGPDSFLDTSGLSGAVIAAPEGDQPALCIGNAVIKPGQAALNVGTSIVIDYLSTSRVEDASGTIDFFFDALGQMLNMGLAANGLQVCDRVVLPYADHAQIRSTSEARKELDGLAADVPADCGGALLIDFGAAETFLGVNKPLSKGVNWPEDAGWGLRWQNARNLTGTLLRMRLGTLSAGGAQPTELVAGGDAAADTALMQTWANALQVPIRVPKLPIPACSLGALRLAAAYEELVFGGQRASFPELIAELCASGTEDTVFKPDPAADAVYARFEQMIRDAVK